MAPEPPRPKRKGAVGETSCASSLAHFGWPGKNAEAEVDIRSKQRRVSANGQACPGTTSTNTRGPSAAKVSSNGEAAAEGGGKAARRRKKKERERRKKERLREDALAKKGVGETPAEVVESRGQIGYSGRSKGRAELEGQDALSKRQKKKANWLRKHPKAVSPVVNADASSEAAKVSESTDRSRVKAAKPDQWGSHLAESIKNSTRWNMGDDESLSDMEAVTTNDPDFLPEDQYMGRRARKSGGYSGMVPGRSGKTRKKDSKAHVTKRERKVKQDAKKAENDNKNRGKGGGGKGGKGDKGGGKKGEKSGKGFSKGRKSQSKGKGKGKGKRKGKR